MTTTLLAIGTNKGLFLARSTDDRRTWTVDGPQFLMNGIYTVAIDTRRATPRLLVGRTASTGARRCSGRTTSAPRGRTPPTAPRISPKAPTSRCGGCGRWAPAPADQPDVVWAGSEPSALWRSEDGGETSPWCGRSGTTRIGRNGVQVSAAKRSTRCCPIPPTRSSVLVAMSTGGVYRTADGGQSWAPANTGIQAVFMPDRFPEFGQCVHKVARQADRPDQLFAQNHNGVYRSDDGGATWSSIADGLPSDFGFAMVAHPRQPGTAYNFPIVDGGERIPPEARCRVYRTTNAGQTWEALSEGLPKSAFYGGVLRDAMCADDSAVAGIYFGTRTGSVFASRDEGARGPRSRATCRSVLCVRAASVA